MLLSKELSTKDGIFFRSPTQVLAIYNTSNVFYKLNIVSGFRIPLVMNMNERRLKLLKR
jgi:hypothetical protein